MSSHTPNEREMAMYALRFLLWHYKRETDHQNRLQNNKITTIRVTVEHRNQPTRVYFPNSNNTPTNTAILLDAIRFITSYLNARAGGPLYRFSTIEVYITWQRQVDIYLRHDTYSLNYRDGIYQCFIDLDEEDILVMADD